MRTVLYEGESFPLGPAPIRGSFAAARGFRFICTTCGKLWGALEVTDSGGYYSLHIPCTEHSTPLFTGGSFLKPLRWWDSPHENLAAILDRVSPELVSHEALMLCNQILKG